MNALPRLLTAQRPAPGDRLAGTGAADSRCLHDPVRCSLLCRITATIRMIQMAILASSAHL